MGYLSKSDMIQRLDPKLKLKKKKEEHFLSEIITEFIN